MAGVWSDHFPAAAKSPARFSPCTTRGVWSDHFPPAADKPPSPATPPPLARRQRCLICPTCNASCRLLKSTTDRNPNRPFYTCPSGDHKFFRWADEARPDEFIDVPYCGGCTAGVCRVRKEKTGPNAGRVLFMCRVKEGEGSCGYRVWADELQNSAVGRADENISSSHSPTINGNHTTPANNGVVEQNKQSNERAGNESPVLIDTPHHLHSNGVASKKMEHLKSQENQRNESSRRAHRISDVTITLFPSANTNLNEENRESVEMAVNESPEINTSEDLHCLGVSSRKMEQLKSQENKRNELSSRATNKYTEPTNNGLVEENERSDEGADNGLSVIDTSQMLQCLGVTIRTTEQQLKCQENQHNESLRRPHKRSRLGDLKAPSSLQSSQSLIVRPTMNSVSVEHGWMVAAIRQNLSVQLQGWWGRLSFHPMPCLMTHASKSLTYYIPSSLDLDSMLIVQDKVLVNCDDSTTLIRKPLFNTLCQSVEPSATKPSCSETRIQNVMSKSISKAFYQAAEHLQNDFLALLEKTDVKDYEAMSRAAEATFSALDRLLFDDRDFKERTSEYIHRATSLAEIEQSMPVLNSSYQKLIEHCSSEKLRLDEINSVHAKAVDCFNDNKKRLKALHEEISSTRDWLFQIEAELLCREVEMRSMERELQEISKDKVVMEEKYGIAANELERSREIRELKEAERDAAKAAFGKARELLRGSTDQVIN